MRAMSPVYNHHLVGHFCFRRHIMISKEKPGGLDDQFTDLSVASSVTPLSRSTIRQSTSGNGTPIDPVRLSPISGLQWCGCWSFRQTVAFDQLSTGKVSNVSFVSRINGAEPEIQALIERKSYFPARTSG